MPTTSFNVNTGVTTVRLQTRERRWLSNTKAVLDYLARSLPDESVTKRAAGRASEDIQNVLNDNPQEL